MTTTRWDVRVVMPVLSVQMSRAGTHEPTVGQDRDGASSQAPVRSRSARSVRAEPRRPTDHAEDKNASVDNWVRPARPEPILTVDNLPVDVVVQIFTARILVAALTHGRHRDVRVGAGSTGATSNTCVHHQTYDSS